MRKYKKRESLIFWFVIALLVAVIIYKFCFDSQTIQSTTIRLDRNVKLEDVSWNHGSIWYLTRPMHSDEIPEVHVLYEKSPTGIGEHCIRFVETKEEIGIEEYIEQAQPGEILRANGGN